MTAGGPADRARVALLDDASRSNREIALAIGATTAQVAGVRRALVSYGVLAPLREPRRAFPAPVPMPRQPWLAEGACVGHPHAHWWTSDITRERDLARQVCGGCHKAPACLFWALRAIPTSDSAIYGGTGPGQRRKLRKMLGITRPNAVAAVNAAKECCPACGLPLAGENLITEAGRRPGTIRRRCRACTRIRKHEAYERRRAQQLLDT
jgi:hypothetical protein